MYAHDSNNLWASLCTYTGIQEARRGGTRGINWSHVFYLAPNSENSEREIDRRGRHAKTHYILLEGWINAVVNEKFTVIIEINYGKLSNGGCSAGCSNSTHKTSQLGRHDYTRRYNSAICSQNQYYIHYITLHYITLHYITLHYITLYYIILYYIILYYIILYYIILYYIILYYIILYYIILYYIILYYIILYYIILYYIILYYIILYYIISYYIILYYIILYYIILYYIILYYIILYYIILYYIS